MKHKPPTIQATRKTTPQSTHTTWTKKAKQSRNKPSNLKDNSKLANHTFKQIWATQIKHIEKQANPKSSNLKTYHPPSQLENKQLENKPSIRSTWNTIDHANQATWYPHLPTAQLRREIWTLNCLKNSTFNHSTNTTQSTTQVKQFEKTDIPTNSWQRQQQTNK